MVISQSQMKLTCDRSKADPLFIYYCFKSPQILDYIQRNVISTGVPHINLTILKQTPLLLPPLDEQKAIAHILGTLDDKIELNQQINHTLESIARALFKSWFIDFDPVRAKLDGRQPAGMDAETAALFPAEFEDGGAIGQIPKGWKVGMMEDEFKITMGQSPPGSTYNQEADGLPFYQGCTDFGFRYPSIRVYCNAPSRFADSGDTLISVRAPVGSINMANERCCIGRGVAAARHKQGSRSYTYYTMHGLNEHFARFEAEGTVFGSMNKKGFLSIPCIIPPTVIISAFEQLAFLLDQRIENQEHQILTLTSIRDVLLPKLLSGEIRLQDAEAVVEAVT
ncbi:restriction endonuclease subunit S [Kovacikia minuta CCNUW1]|uniref:restriction endonuclease subunit S n=1 Tax=Kovacikia minuta TaxID=2931930 RepID=UPI001CCA252A|nr:restriction endonuclease subunit S [Kovacikia minuta]UBF29624.1 restriction endonuclease subunit S [Kovacikia minuta CCNUW1]